MEKTHAELKAQYEAELLDNLNAAENWQAKSSVSSGWLNFKKLSTISWWAKCAYRRDPNALPLAANIKDMASNRHPRADLIIAIANGAQGQIQGPASAPEWHNAFQNCVLHELVSGHRCVQIKPTLKLIDWSKMPVGTMTDRGRLIAIVDGDTSMLGGGIWLRVLECNRHIIFYPMSHFRLAEQTDFTYWPGGECPIPQGVKVQVTIRDGELFTYEQADTIRWNHTYHGGDIIAYRITGLVDGYTDNPSEAQ